MSHTVWKNVPHLNTYWGDIYYYNAHVMYSMYTDVTITWYVWYTKYNIIHILITMYMQ